MEKARFPANFGGKSDKFPAYLAGVSRVRSVPGRIRPGGRANWLNTFAICLLNPGGVSWFSVSFHVGNLGRRAGIRPGVWLLRASVNKSSNKEKRTHGAKCFNLASVARFKLCPSWLFSWPWLGLYYRVGCWVWFFPLCPCAGVRLVASQGHEKTRHKGRARCVWCGC